MKEKLFQKIFVERETLCKKEGFGGSLAAFFVFLIVTLLGLWLCSCSAQKYCIARHGDIFEFEMDMLASYDADRNMGSYVVFDTIKAFDKGKSRAVGYVCDTVEISFEGILIEELEQGEAAYVDEGRVLYD